MELGVGLPTSGAWATPANMRRVAGRAEELGYRSLWTFQRLLHPLDTEWGPEYHAVNDPVTALAYVAGLTSRIRLGIAVVNIPYYAPIVLAKALTTLDIVSAGRLDVGLGLGWSPLEFAAAGVPFERRGARAEEFIRCLATIWTNPEAGFHGDFYALPPARVEPKPIQSPHPPLLLGGSADAALRRAGRLADGWISSSRADLGAIGSSIEVVRTAARQAGRDPAALRFVVRGVVRLGSTAECRPLHGTAGQIRSDLAALEASGVTEVFFDLNWDPRVTGAETDPAWTADYAEELLTKLAP